MKAREWTTKSVNYASKGSLLNHIATAHPFAQELIILGIILGIVLGKSLCSEGRDR